MSAGGRVFLSFRRPFPGRTAHLLRACLVHEGHDVFMDVAEVGGGRFDSRIGDEIRSREHFLVVLEPGSLDGGSSGADRFRREIAVAIEHGRSVVPVLVGSFAFPDDLPVDIVELRTLHGVRVVPAFVDEVDGPRRDRYRPWRPPAMADGPELPPVHLTVESQELLTGPVEVTGGPAELVAWLLGHPESAPARGPSGEPVFVEVMSAFSVSTGRSQHHRRRLRRR